MKPDHRDTLHHLKRTADNEARRFRASDQDKQRQAEDLKRRFARYSSGGSKVTWLKGPGPRWGRWIVAALGVAYLMWVVLA